jgi:hypothetical protein
MADINCCIRLSRLLDESAVLDVVEDAVEVEVVCVPVSPELVEPLELLVLKGGGGGGPLKLPKSPIDEAKDDEELVLELEPSDDSSWSIMLSSVLERSDTLDVVDAELVVDVEPLPPAPPIPPGGGGGRPWTPPESPIDEAKDAEELVLELEPSADSSCCIMLSSVLARSDTLDVVDAELVDAVELLLLAPPMPPGGGGGGPSMVPADAVDVLEDWACSRLDIMPDDRLPRK